MKDTLLQINYIIKRAIEIQTEIQELLGLLDGLKQEMFE